MICVHLHRDTLAHGWRVDCGGRVGGSYSRSRSNGMWPRVMMVKGRGEVMMDLEMFGKFSEMMTTALFY